MSKGRLIGRAIVILLVVAAAFLAWQRSSGSVKTAKGAAVQARDQQPKQKTTSIPGTGGHAARPTTNSRQARNIALVRQISRFYKAYYLLKPDDTTVTVQNRLTGMVSPSFEQNYGPSVDRTSLTGQARIKHGVVITEAGISALTADAVQGDANLFDAHVTVEVLATDKSGTVISRHDESSVSRWRFDGRKWVVVSFLPDLST